MNKMELAMTNPNEIPQIKGLLYYKKIISKSFSEELIDFLLGCPDWKNINKNNPKSRRVIHYGYEYDFKKGYIHKKTTDMPPIILELRNMISLCGINDTHFNQCIINEYTAGQGISSHIDNPKYGDTICCFSIGSTAMLNMKRELADGNEEHEIFIKPRSLYIMTKDARYKYKHGIPGRKYDTHKTKTYERTTRYSITFRIVK